MFFNSSSQSQVQRALLDNYLTEIRDKEKLKLEGRRKQIEEEKNQLDNLQKQILIDADKDRLKK